MVFLHIHFTMSCTCLCNNSTITVYNYRNSQIFTNCLSHCRKWDSALGPKYICISYSILMTLYFRTISGQVWPLEFVAWGRRSTTSQLAGLEGVLPIFAGRKTTDRRARVYSRKSQRKPKGRGLHCLFEFDNSYSVSKFCYSCRQIHQ